MRRKKSILISILLLIIAIGFGVTYFRNQRSLNFQAYQPTVLPEGIEIKKHEVSITTTPSRKYKTVIIDTNTSDFYIGEQKTSPEDYTSNSFSCSTKEESSTCITYISPNKQSYDVRTSFNASEAFDQTISWLKNETRFWISLDNDQVQKYTPESWGKIVDSFSPIDYSSEPIKQYKATPS